VWTVAAAGGDGGGSMGLGTHGVLAQDCPEFSPRVLWAICPVISHRVKVTWKALQYINVSHYEQVVAVTSLTIPDHYELTDIFRVKDS
jgi:hypothetical protein